MMKIYIKKMWMFIKKGFNNIISGRKWNDKTDK